MLLTMHQPEHLPWLGFFHKMAQADLYVFADDVQFEYQYVQNRNLIRGTHAPVRLCVPVRDARSRPLLSAIRIDDSRNWRKRYWGSIEYQYRRHPHFERYAGSLRAIVHRPHERLIDLNLDLIRFFREAFEIRTPFLLSSELGVSLAKSERIHRVCERLGASAYLSGPSGRAYLDEAPFRATGIAVHYHHFEHPRYHQHGELDFTPRLSALDLLFNCGPASRSYLLEPVRAIALTG